MSRLSLHLWVRRNEADEVGSGFREGAICRDPPLPLVRLFEAAPEPFRQIIWQVDRECSWLVAHPVKLQGDRRIGDSPIFSEDGCYLFRWPIRKLAEIEHGSFRAARRKFSR